jgi:hypothetical protein
MNNQIEIIRCNHCSRSHRSDYCIKTGKVPSNDCIEDDINESDFENDIPRILSPRTRLK